MVGTTVSHYRILERLGGGGMGVVYKAEDLRLRRIVAVKFLPFDLTSDPEAKERFIQEARSASSITHPNISTVHDLDETPEGQLFIVQEYHGSQTLKDVLVSQGHLDLNTALAIALQIARGLAEVHRKGIIHRDIKPSNIMITDDWTVKIVDFGLAKLQSPSTVTKEGVRIGTPAYMAPEQLRGTLSSNGTDVWGVGVLLYEMLTGRRPFQSDFEEGVVYAILHERPPALSALRPEVPPDLDRIVARTLDQNPAKRYPDMESLASDLQIVRRGMRLAGVGAFLRRMIVPGYTRRRFTAIAVALIAAIIFFLTVPSVLSWWTGTQTLTMAVVSCGDQTEDHLDHHLLFTVSDALSRYLSAFPQFDVTTVSELASLGEEIGRPALRTDEGVPILSAGTAQEICRNEGLDRMLVPAIAKLPSGDYTLSLELKDPRTNKLVATGVSPAMPLRDLMEGIHQAIGALIRETEIPPEQAKATVDAVTKATTHSIEAYQDYAMALFHMSNFRTREFSDHLQHAIIHDSTFGSAYILLAAKEAQYYNFRGAREILQRAEELGVLDLSPEERHEMRIGMVMYKDRYATATMRKRNSLQEAFVERYPDNKIARVKLGSYHRELGEIPEAIDQMEETLELDASFKPALNELAWIHAYLLGNFATGMEYINKVESLDPGTFSSLGTRACIRYMMGDIGHSIYLLTRASEKVRSWNSHIIISYVYAMQEDYDIAEEQLGIHFANVNTPFMRGHGQLMGAYLQLWRGRLKESREQIRNCLAVAESTDNHALQAEAEWLQLWGSLWEPETSDPGALPAVWRKSPGLERVVNPWYHYFRGRSDLQAGRLDSLEFYATQNDAEDERIVIRDQEIEQSLAVNLRRERLLALDSARASLALALPTPRFAALVPHINCFVEPGLDGPRTSLLFSFSGDLDARTYVALGDTDHAILEYERLMQQDPARRIWIPPLYHYALATLYDQAGAPERAIHQYEIFLKIWDRADSAFVQPRIARVRLHELTRKDDQELPGAEGSAQRPSTGRTVSREQPSATPHSTPMRRATGALLAQEKKRP